MNFYIIAAAWSLVAGICGVGWYYASVECRRWRNLERIQANRLNELLLRIDETEFERARLDKFRAQPGMETVSDTYARKMLDLQAENVKLTAEGNALRLEVAKYIDMYRNERYKPVQKGARRGSF